VEICIDRLEICYKELQLVLRSCMPQRKNGPMEGVSTLRISQ